MLMVGLGLLLFLFLAVMTLMINPPEKWVQKLTGQDEKKNSKK